MTGTTDLGVTYPTPTDVHPSSGWWKTLALTANTAIKQAKAAAVATANAAIAQSASDTLAAAKSDAAAQISDAEFAAMSAPDQESVRVSLQTYLTDPASDARQTLNGNYAPILTAVSGDQTAALNAWLSTASPLGVKQAVGSFSISDKITVPPGVYLDATRATFTQTGSKKVSCELQAGATIQGGTWNGLGTDFVAGTNITPTAIGIQVTGAGAAVNLATILNHAGAGIYLAAGSAGFKSNLVEIAAPAITIPAGDSACFGVYALSDTGHTFSGLHLHDLSIGLISALSVSQLSISNLRVHDIHGQHGLYIQNGTGLTINGVSARTINLNGIKLQLSVSSTADSVGASISNVNADSCGDCAVSVNNTATDLTSAHKIVGLTLANVVATNCFRGIYLGSVRGGTVTGITVSSCSSDGITLLDCQNIIGTGWLVDGSGRVGLRLTTQTGAVQARLKISVRINNPGGANVAGNLSGIYFNSGSNVTLEAVVTATNGLMDYGLFMSGSVATDQQTLTVQNSDFSGATTNQDVRLQAGPVGLRAWVNNRVGSTILNFPVGIPVRVGSRGSGTIYSCNAVPTSGQYWRGDQVLHSAPATGSPKSWLCTVAGTPGTWVSEGNL